MFEVRCPTCQRRFINEVNSFVGLQCCKQPLPEGDAFQPIAPAHRVQVTDSKHKPTRKLPVACKHRGERVGVADCGCNGPRIVYRCTKLIRPTAILEPAYCWSIQPVKYHGIKFDDGSRLDSYSIPRSEIIECSRRQCEFFEPREA